MRRSRVKTQLDRDSPIAAVLRVVAQKQWAGLVPSLGSRSGTGRTNKVGLALLHDACLAKWLYSLR